MNVRLSDLVSGVRAVSNSDGFPLESFPPQGEVIVEFGTGAVVSVNANMDEFEQVNTSVGQKRTAETGASEFLRRATSGNYRIVNSGDLDRFQISEAQANGLFYVDPETSYGWALLPWDLTTTRDRQREADYFSSNNMMV